jgi:hypothetical protein
MTIDQPRPRNLSGLSVYAKAGEQVEANRFTLCLKSRSPHLLSRANADTAENEVHLSLRAVFKA